MTYHISGTWLMSHHVGPQLNSLASWFKCNPEIYLTFLWHWGKGFNRCSGCFYTTWTISELAKTCNILSLSLERSLGGATGRRKPCFSILTGLMHTWRILDLDHGSLLWKGQRRLGNCLYTIESMQGRVQRLHGLQQRLGGRESWWAL